MNKGDGALTIGRNRKWRTRSRVAVPNLNAEHTSAQGVGRRRYFHTMVEDVRGVPMTSPGLGIGGQKPQWAEPQVGGSD